ncbi:MAG TPA: hypothetical protein VH479_04060, partial [Acidimicrobiales bacterium]
VFTDTPLSSMPTDWASAGSGNRWQVNRHDDVTATYTVTIKSRAGTDNTVGQVTGVEFVWEAQQR